MLSTGGDDHGDSTDGGPDLFALANEADAAALYAALSTEDVASTVPPLLSLSYSSSSSSSSSSPPVDIVDAPTQSPATGTPGQSGVFSDSMQPEPDRSHGALADSLDLQGYPTKMTLTVTEVVLPSHSPKQKPDPRVVFRGKRVDPKSLLPNQPPSFEMALTYHSILFDTVKIDLHDHRSAFVGRARVRINHLPKPLRGRIRERFDLLPRRDRPAIRSLAFPPENGGPTGHVVVEMSFSDHVVIGGDASSDAGSAAGVIDSSVLGNLGDAGLALSFGERNLDVDVRAGQVDEFAAYFQAVGGSGQSMQQVDFSSLSRPVASDVGSLSSSGTLLRFRPRTRKSGSERTSTGFQEFASISSAFFNHGWQISKAEFVRALSLVSYWQSQNRLPPDEKHVVTDPRKLRVATYFLRFAIANYGSLVMNIFGAGSGYLRDVLRPNADMKTSLEYLEIHEEDMLEWSYSGTEAFKPKFYICYDRATESIVLSLRGTCNIHEIVTDICAEYEPFLGGYAHRGFLRCALWLEDHALPKLTTHILRHRARGLYITGHSLGAAIGSIFTLILARRHLPSLRAAVEQHGRGDGARFRLHCVGFACPPCLDPALAASARSLCDNFANRSDIVPTLGYGAVVEFRDLLVHAASLQRRRGLFMMEKIASLQSKHIELKDSAVYPKLHIPGTVYLVHRASSPAPGAEQGRYVCEVVDASRLESVRVGANMLLHHLPSRYDTALRQAHEWLMQPQ